MDVFPERRLFRKFNTVKDIFLILISKVFVELLQNYENNSDVSANLAWSRFSSVPMTTGTGKQWMSPKARGCMT